MSTPNISEQTTIDEKASKENKDVTSSHQKLMPFYRLFTTKFVALALSIIASLLLILALFFQLNEQSQLVIENQLKPLQNKVKQLESLQKANLIVGDLLSGNSEKNWLSLHSDLVSLNLHLIRLNSTDISKYRKWLNQNKLASDTVERAEKNKSRNQQLKQSSVIQLQLMLFTVNRILDQSDLAENELFQFKGLLSELLTSFEDLSISTSQSDFDLLRLGVEELFAESNLLPANDTTLEYLKQVESFKRIVLTEQMALAKWQGYLRLMQSYHIDLRAQQQQISALLSNPEGERLFVDEGRISSFLAEYNVPLTSKDISLLLMGFIVLFLIIVFVFLWKIKQGIKLASHQSLVLVTKEIQGEEIKGEYKVNCLETNDIIEQIQLLAKPIHSEQEYQQLVSDIKAKDQVAQEQQKKLEELAESSDEKHHEKSAQVEELFNHEVMRYSYLKNLILPTLIDTQSDSFNNTSKNTIVENKVLALGRIYNSLEVFELASFIQSNNAVLTLNNVDLLEEIYAVILNKQSEYLASENQLFISHDEQIIPQTNLDVQLFTHLANLFLDFALRDCKGALLHLHLRLQDKNAGQQIIRFELKLYSKNPTELPSYIKELTQASNKSDPVSSLPEVFNIMLSQLHGDNITANLNDDGYQVSFELPLAITDESKNAKVVSQINKDNGVALADTKVMVLSANKVVTSIVEKLVISCAGKCECIRRTDSFLQSLTVKNLRRQKVDLIIVTSDIAINNKVEIEEKIADLPESLQPKLMFLQSSQLSYQAFGRYNQAEQPLCKAGLIENIKQALLSDQANNLILDKEVFQHKKYQKSQLCALLAVESPQQYQPLQSLLQWLGLNVHFVSNITNQDRAWKTGRFSLLITEFTQDVWVNMSSQPMLPVGVFGLSSDIKPNNANNKVTNDSFAQWQCGQLSLTASIPELTEKLSSWLKVSASNTLSEKSSNHHIPKTLTEDDLSYLNADNDELVINEVADCLIVQEGSDATLDFSRYLKHQGSVELALFMLDDYTQDNHLQLANLATAIKEKDHTKAKHSLEKLQLNAQILAADDLQILCEKWTVLLNNEKSFTTVKNTNELLKDTQQMLHAIDSYAETI